MVLVKPVDCSTPNSKLSSCRDGTLAHESMHSPNHTYTCMHMHTHAHAPTYTRTHAHTHIGS